MIATANFSPHQGSPAQPQPMDQSVGTTVDTEALIRLIQSKNERGFHILYDKYCGALYSILLKLVRRTDVAQDLLQEVFVKIWRHIDRFDPSKGTLFTWMLNIARNHAIDYLRSSGYQQRLQQVDIDSFSPYIEDKGAIDLNTSEMEMKDFNSKALDLDPKYAEVIDMIYFYGWTYEQTAQILNLPLGTVKTRARKGLSMLKILYQE